MTAGGVAGPSFNAETCGVSAEPFSLRWRKGQPAISYPPLSEDSVTDRQIEAFRSAVVSLEARGCLKPGGAADVLDAVAGSLALPPRMIYFARYGVYYDRAALDFEPGFRLKVVSPLLKAGFTELKIETVIPEKQGPIEVKVGDELEGYETSYYDLLPARGGGVRLQLLAVEQNRRGALAHPVAPSSWRPEIPAGFPYLRLLFLRRASRSDRDITLLAARSLAALDEAGQRIESSADALDTCRAERGAHCLVVPRHSALNLELVVTANNREVSVPVGGTVAGALDAAGLTTRAAQRAAAANLRVLRPWRGRLLPVRPDGGPEMLLSMVLIGGEQITW